MKRKGAVGMYIIYCLLLFMMFLSTASYYNSYQYAKNHPCIEYKTLCYYLADNSDVGVSTSGDFVFMSGHTNVYIDCEDKDIYPNVKEMRKCVKREGIEDDN